MKTPVRAFLAVAILASGRSAAATPVPAIAYQNCWVDYWDTGQLWCDIWVEGHLLEEDGIQPAWSPDGSKIAFSRLNPGYGVVVLDVVTGTFTGIGPGRAPAWSPDGSKIVYRVGESAGDLVVANADGSGEVQLTTSGDVEGRAGWSPDGTRIAYGCLGASGNRDICTIKPDGTGIVQLNDDPEPDSDPAFSPDGATIAFTADFGIYLMAADGTGRHFLASGYGPAWSPDGTRIALTLPFSGACQADGYLCYDTLSTLDVDGTGEQSLHTGANPSWTGSAQLVRPIAHFSSYCDSVGRCNFYGDAWDLNGTIVSQVWDFGDGTTASGPAYPMDHTYAAVGTYAVTYTVTDNDGLTTTRTGSVNIPPRLRAAFTFTCTGRQCAFDGTGSTDPNGTIVSYYWEFGDGSTGQGPTPNHTYANGGVYQVYLIVTDDQGTQAGLSHYVTVTVPAPPVAAFSVTCTNNQCAFDGRGSSDPDGTIASYAWTFGDGATGSGSMASRTYAAAGTYTASLTVTDNDGLQNTVSHAVTVTMPPVPPVAAFAVACAETVCAFNGSGSYDPDGTIAAYAWTFGDGATGSGATASHTYAAAGTYTASLTVTDNQGLQGTGSHSATATTPRSHVGDLDGTTTGGGSSWTATVTAVVHATGEAVLANATVTGTWSLGGSSSCTTNAVGQCAISKGSIPNKTHSVTFTVTGVTHATRTYNAEQNHDPDGDSTGTVITVSR